MNKTGLNEMFQVVLINDNEYNYCNSNIVYIATLLFILFDLMDKL